MRARLAKKPELAEVLIPDWHVGCRRLTPGVGYLEALCEDHVNVVTSGIRYIDKTGIATADGKHHEVDIIVCATGFDVSTRPHFDVVGRDGYVFTDEWAKSPKGYMTLAMSNMPNYFRQSASFSSSGLLFSFADTSLRFLLQCSTARTRLSRTAASYRRWKLKATTLSK